MSTFLLFCITFVLSQGLNGVNGMDCSLGTSENIIQKITSHCPGLFDHEDEKYCCFNSDGELRCCNVFEWAFTTLSVLILLAIVGLIISSIISCICCLFLPCCCMYKRRNRGRVLQPGTVVTVGPYAVPPNYCVPAGASIPYRPVAGQPPSYIP